MFSLFRKRNSYSGLRNNPNLIDFQNSLTEQQKAAIIYSLMLMAVSEGNYDSKKMDYVEQQAELLNIDLEGKSMSIYKEKNADYAYSVIKDFSKSQKDFYSILLGNIMLVNGDLTDNEMKLADRILTECEISEDQFKGANTKAQTLWNKFNS